MKFIILISLCVSAFALPAPEDESQAKTIVQNSLINLDGSYAYEYQTSNDIAAKADADDKNLVNGEYSYKNSDGSEVKVVYKAGAGIGFMPLEGVHPAILKALQYIEANPPKDGPRLDVRSDI